MSIITNMGITVILTYIIISIFSFYGVGFDAYGIYLLFYLFIIFSTNILPTQVPDV